MWLLGASFLLNVWNKLQQTSLQSASVQLFVLPLPSLLFHHFFEGCLDNPVWGLKAGMHGWLAKLVDLSRVEATDIPGPSIHLPNTGMQSLRKIWFKTAVTSFLLIASKLCPSKQHQVASAHFPGFHGHVLGLPTIIFYSKTMIT